MVAGGFLMGEFASWLMGFVSGALTWLYNFLIYLVQHLSDALVDLILFIVTLFPQACIVPMPSVPSLSGSATSVGVFFLQALNWLFPVSYLITVVQWLTCGMMLFIMIAPLARWAKLLD